MGPTLGLNKHIDPAITDVAFIASDIILLMIEDNDVTFHIVSTARRNARIASAALAIPISVRLSVCLSVCLSVTRRYWVETTACSTVQFAPSDSKMCLLF